MTQHNDGERDTYNCPRCGVVDSDKYPRGTGEYDTTAEGLTLCGKCPPGEAHEVKPYSQHNDGERELRVGCANCGTPMEDGYCPKCDLPQHNDGERLLLRDHAAGCHDYHPDPGCPDCRQHNDGERWWVRPRDLRDDPTGTADTLIEVVPADRPREVEAALEQADWLRREVQEFIYRKDGRGCLHLDNAAAAYDEARAALSPQGQLDGTDGVYLAISQELDEILSPEKGEG